MTTCRACGARQARALCSRCVRVRDAAKNARRGSNRRALVAAVKRRDGGCIRRGRGSPCFGPLEVDHIVRLADGGRNTMDNMRTLCRLHHRTRRAWEQALRSGGGGGSNLQPGRVPVTPRQPHFYTRKIGVNLGGDKSRERAGGDL